MDKDDIYMAIQKIREDMLKLQYQIDERVEQLEDDSDLLGKLVRTSKHDFYKVMLDTLEGCSNDEGNITDLEFAAQEITSELENSGIMLEFINK